MLLGLPAPASVSRSSSEALTEESGVLPFATARFGLPAAASPAPAVAAAGEASGEPCAPRGLLPLLALRPSRRS